MRASLMAFCAAVLSMVGLTGQTAALDFAAKPAVTRSGDAVTVSFAATQATDVEAAVLDGGGRIVRHLAAGVLGADAPAPLVKGRLVQSLLWDGKDDAGRPILGVAGGGASAGPFTVRVRLGLAPRLVKYVGPEPCYWDNQVRGVAVDPAGEVYVLSVMGSGYAGTRAFVRVLDREGRYRRTIVPYPADLAPERTEAIGQVLADGQRLPLVTNGYSATLAPMLTGMPRQTMAWHPTGRLLMAGAVGSMDDMGPPRHLLAVDREGGAAGGLGFVGPQIESARGRAAGAGDGRLCYDAIAVSPDGQFFYFSESRSGKSKPRHAVYRGRWTDAQLAVFAGVEGEAGEDETHLRDPQGLATDAAGNLYVCDAGNGRLVILSPAGKRLEAVEIEGPQQVAVHPKTGAIYVACRSADAAPGAAPQTTLRKLSPLSQEAVRETWRQVVPGPDLLALDPTAVPVRLWLVISEKGRPTSLVPADEKDGRLELGAPIGAARDLVPVGLMSAGREANEVLFASGNGFVRLDLESGEQTPLALAGGARLTGEIYLGRDGHLYVQAGSGGQDLYRFNAKGDPLPFEAVGGNRLKLARPTKGLRGLCVTRDGAIYVLAWDYRKRTYLDSYDAQGRPARQDIVEGLASGATAVQVASDGSIYITENVKPPEALFPAPFSERVPTAAWKWFDGGERRSAPWCYTYDNPYLSFWGCVMKFPASGGVIYGLAAGSKPVAEAPAGTPLLKSGYLARDVKVAGALWVRPHTTYAGSHDFGTDGANCMCISTRTALDDFGRLFAPDPYRACVTVLDAAGNVVARIGAYGNIDSAGLGSRVPQPAIALAWPRYVARMQDRLVISDAVNRRLAVVALGGTAEATCPVPSSSSDQRQTVSDQASGISNPES
jgi:DNA-binding beta-propeller fold protein YncE